jgi:hypothetical protein
MQGKSFSLTPCQWVQSAHYFCQPKHVNGIDKGVPEFIGDIFIATEPQVCTCAVTRIFTPIIPKLDI